MGRAFMIHELNHHACIDANPVLDFAPVLAQASLTRDPVSMYTAALGPITCLSCDPAASSLSQTVSDKHLARTTLLLLRFAFALERHSATTHPECFCDRHAHL